MAVTTLHDEFGDTGIIQPDAEEVRKDSNGRVLGPRPDRDWQLSYDEKQLPEQDVNGNVIDGP